MILRWARHPDGHWHSRWQGCDLGVTWLGSGRWRWSARIEGLLIGDGVANSIGEAKTAAMASCSNIADGVAA